MNSWRPVSWGNQEPLVPINPAALVASPNQRILELAEPKKIYVEASMDLRTEIDRIRSAPAAIGGKVRYKEPTQRIVELAEPKKPFVLANANKKYEIVHSKEVIKSALSEEQLVRLSTPSQLKNFTPDRPGITQVSKAALYGNIPESVDRLSTPKKRMETNYRNPVWEVTKATKHANPSSRIRELARPKALPEGFMPQRINIFKPTAQSLHAVCTRRVNELALPIRRESMSHCLYNPDAFKVKTNALIGRIPDHVDGLSAARA